MHLAVNWLFRIKTLWGLRDFILILVLIYEAVAAICLAHFQEKIKSHVAMIMPSVTGIYRRHFTEVVSSNITTSEIVFTALCKITLQVQRLRKTCCHKVSKWYNQTWNQVWLLVSLILLLVSPHHFCDN